MSNLKQNKQLSWLAALGLVFLVSQMAYNFTVSYQGIGGLVEDQIEENLSMLSRQIESQNVVYSTVMAEMNKKDVGLARVLAYLVYRYGAGDIQAMQGYADLLGVDEVCYINDKSIITKTNVEGYINYNMLGAPQSRDFTDSILASPTHTYAQEPMPNGSFGALHQYAGAMIPGSRTEFVQVGHSVDYITKIGSVLGLQKELAAPSDTSTLSFVLDRGRIIAHSDTSKIGATVVTERWYPQLRKADTTFTWLEIDGKNYLARARLHGPYHSVSMVSETYYDAKTGPVFRSIVVFSVAFIVVAVFIYLLFHRIQGETRRAEVALLAKNRFLSNISHEIRTPINAIMGFGRAEFEKSQSPSSRANHEKILRSGNMLLGIINDLLDISKLESGQFDLKPMPYSVPKLLGDALFFNKIHKGDKPIEFSLDIPENLPKSLIGDEIRVKQILSNLLSNAFKYTLKGKVELSVSFEPATDVPHSCFVTVRVKDSGLGIREEDQKRLFSEYIRTETATTRFIEGTGLGLPICKQLAELMDGSVSVQSTLGVGSEFTVRFRQGMFDATPLSEEDYQNLVQNNTVAETQEVKEENQKDFSATRALIVDDMEINLEVAQTVFAIYGIKADTLTSGIDAIEAVRKENPRYDIVFMDHMMPGMDGIEATRQIHTLIGTDYAQHLPVVALTANALIGNEQMFLDNGFCAFLPKPIEPAKLEQILSRYGQFKIKSSFEKEIESFAGQGGDEFLPREIQGIDMEYALSRFAGQRKPLRKVLESFVAHIPTALQRLQDSFVQGEGELSAYAITAHGIKGSARAIGATDMGNFAEELEIASKAGNWQEVQVKHAKFIQMVEELLTVFRKTLGRHADQQADPLSHLPEPSPELLQEILEAAQTYNTKVFKAKLAELESHSYDKDQDLADWICDQGRNLEYEAVARRLAHDAES